MRRRAPGNVPSSIRLDHGDVLDMDGLAQSEYAHCTVPGLQGPRVNLTYRWVAQHTASCPLAGLIGGGRSGYLFVVCGYQSAEETLRNSAY